MKRLLDSGAPLDAADRELAELLRASRRYEANPFVKRRVLIQTLRVATQPARPRLRSALAAVLLVCGTASAAAFGGSYLVQGGSSWFTPALAPAAPPSEAAKSEVPRRAQPAALEPAPAAPVLEAAPGLVSRPAPQRPDTESPVRSRGRAAGKSLAHAAERAAPSEDPSDVVAAIRALRRKRDPSRAQELLDGYLAAHPNGVLSEDALALSIEAASGRHDARASEYARRYLAQFPKGKYRALAQRALSQP